jgi:hypothetical protein
MTGVIRPVSAQGVVAALKRAGFNRAEPMSGPASLQEHTAGWQVRKPRAAAGAVEVRWLPCSLDLETNTPRKTRRVRALLRYADVLVLAGFRARLDGEGEKLIVSSVTIRE